MELERFVAALERDLAAVAALGSEEAAAAAQRLTQALRASAGMRLLEALGEAALELSAQLPQGHVEIRLAGSDPQLVYVGGDAADETPVPVDDGLTARITLRLPDALKRDIEAAAARDGVSVNTWLVRALARSVAPPPRRGRNRLTGYGRN